MNAVLIVRSILVGTIVIGVGLGPLSVSMRADQRASDPALFRIFLKDGTTVASYGEFARVGERVVFTLPLGAGREHLASIGAADVDWTLTDGYTNAVRAAHYAATVGDAEFSAMSARIAGTLTEIARDMDPMEQLRRAEGARRELVEWPSRHYGYKADEIHETLSVLDQVIAGLRAKTNGARFDISLVAGPAAPPPVTLLGPPTLQDSIEQALRLSRSTESPSERVELMRSALSAIEADPTAGDAAWAGKARASMRATIEGELATDKIYASLTNEVVVIADKKARNADVRGLTKLRAETVSRDAKLGRRRPEQLQALLATLDQRLDAAQRLRLARDQYAVRSRSYAAYRRAVSSPMNLLQRATLPLTDIRALAGPSEDALSDLGRRLDRLRPSLRAIVAPADLQATHASLVSACQLADAAVRQRQRAVAQNDMALARNASAAAAGALMLFERVQAEIARLFEVPQLP
jgi:hypothetical protein